MKSMSTWRVTALSPETGEEFLCIEVEADKALVAITIGLERLLDLNIDTSEISICAEKVR